MIERLTSAGFATVADGEAASVATSAARIGTSVPDTPVFAIDTSGAAPAVSLERVSASHMRVAGQAVTVAATVRARGVRGRTSELRLEDGGLTVASATHRWEKDDETWQSTLAYLPPVARATLLRVVVDKEAADLLVPPQRGPVRTLVFNLAITWAGAFVRRALEAEPGFGVASVQRTTKTAVTRAGPAPAVLTRNDLADFEVLVCGNPDDLDAAAVGAIRWFVEARGGVAVFVPDRVPSRPTDLLSGVSFGAKRLESPVMLTGTPPLTVSELALPKTLPPWAETLAAHPDGSPVVFTWRRGAGAIVFSGALDAWRYRDRNDSAFARFWSSALLAQAATVPGLLEVTASPSVVRPGEAVHVAARVRATELASDGDRVDVPPASATATNPAARLDTAVRLWPTPEPGVYEGEWRPAAAGDYAVSASIGRTVAAAVVRVAVASQVSVRDGTTAIVARASGGGVFTDDAALVDALARRFPAATVMRPSHPTRSPWWAGAVVLLLCAEWTLRRRQGLP